MTPKFRAWDKRSKEMWKVSTLHIEDEYVDIFKKNIYENPLNDPWAKFEDVVLMQYTGLKDKNGTEIYEGDILLIDDDGYETTISEVTWGGEEYPAFDIPKYDGDTMNGFAAIYFSDLDITMEVIGNIYENPELLSEVE